MRLKTEKLFSVLDGRPLNVFVGRVGEILCIKESPRFVLQLGCDKNGLFVNHGLLHRRPECFMLP